MEGHRDNNAHMSALPKQVSGVVDPRRIRKQSLPFLLVWITYYAWVIAFTTWWTASPFTESAFSPDFRSLIHTVNMLSSVICVFAFKKDSFIFTARVGAVAVAVSFGLFLLAPFGQLKGAAAILLGASLGCMNISILLPFIFILNNTEKLYAIIVGNALSNTLSLLLHMFQYGGEALAAVSILVIALFTLVSFSPKHTERSNRQPVRLSSPASESSDNKAQDDLMAKREIRLAMILTILASTLGAILFLGAGKALLNIFLLTPGGSVLSLGGTGISPEALVSASSVVLPWYYLGGIIGSLLYLLLFSLPRGSVHLALSLPFGCLALGVLCNAFSDRMPEMEIAFAFLLGTGTTMGMSTVYYVLGVVGKKYGSMLYVRLSILIIGIFGGISAVCIGALIGNAGQDAQVSLMLTLASSAASVALLVCSPTIARVCFDDLWAGNVTLPDIADLEETKRLVERTDMLEGLNLTPREKEVCMLLLKGLTVRQISGRLGLAFATVNGYYRSLYRKLNINSKVELFLRFGAQENTDSSSRIPSEKA